MNAREIATEDREIRESQSERGSIDSLYRRKRGRKSKIKQMEIEKRKIDKLEKTQGKEGGAPSDAPQKASRMDEGAY